MKKEFLKILQNALKGIELSEEEISLIKWIADWDLSTVQIFSQIINKCRDDTGISVENQSNAKTKITYEHPTDNEIKSYMKIIEEKELTQDDMIAILKGATVKKVIREYQEGAGSRVVSAIEITYPAPKN